jgi:UDP:flavonoid glycosyltransferase YjiC (YdhE family)
MRILFVPLSGPSHYFPQVPLAWASRTAGHEVRVAAQPSIAGLVTRSGLTAVEVGRGYDFASHAGDLPQAVKQQLGRLPSSIEAARAAATSMPPEMRKQLTEAKWAPQVAATDAMAADLLPFARWWRPDLVVTDSAALVAPLISENLGVPLVRNLFGPYIGVRVGAPGRGLPVEEWPDTVKALYERYGVEVRADYTVRTVDPCPESMQVPGVPQRLPIRYIPYNDAGPHEEWIGEPSGKPRVCVTLGTVTERSVTGSTRHLTQEIVAALAGFDVEIVVAIKRDYTGDLGELPEHVRVVHDVPLQLMVPTCAALVHHGGAGSIMTAAYYGVPQVGVTQVPDTTFLSEQMAGTGAGVSLRADQTDVDAIKAALSTVLADGAAREAAGRLREEILAQPSPPEVVATLEELA